MDLQSNRVRRPLHLALRPGAAVVGEPQRLAVPRGSTEVNHSELVGETKK